MTPVEDKKVLEEPRKRYGPIAKMFIGSMGVLLGGAGLALALDGGYLEALGAFGLAFACFFALVTGIEIHDGAEERRQLVACPCCGHPTFDARVSEGSCILCEWELGENADNLGYTVEEGQLNFERFSTFFRAR